MMMSDAPDPTRALRAAVSGRYLKITQFHAATSLSFCETPCLAISLAGGITRTAATRTVFMPPPFAV
jgi:hypothetical protein